MAAFYVLPAILAIDALSRPRSAWERAGRRKWIWVATFLAPVPLSVLAGSIIPAVVVAGASAFYMAKIRSLLDAAMILELSPDPSAFREHEARRAAAAPWLVGLPVMGVGVAAATSATGPERLLAAAIGLAGFAGSAIASAVIYQRARQG